MSLSTLVFFNGDCKAAFRCYAATFDGKVELLLAWGASPMAGQVPPEWQEKILFGRMSIGSSELLGGDVPPGSYVRPEGMALRYDPKDVADAERIFHVLAEGGEVEMPLQQTFWSAAYGMVRDRFGVPWELNCSALPAA